MKLLKRPELGSNALAVLVALYLLAVANVSFWKKALIGFDTPLTFLGFALTVTAVFTAIAIAVSSRWVAKPIYIVMLMVAAPAAYFTDTFGTIINQAMIENAVTTTTGEARYLITWQFVLHVLVFGLLPSLLVLWVKVRHRPFISKVAYNSLTVGLLLVVAGGITYLELGRFIVTLRQDHAMLEVFNPSGPISSAVKFSVNYMDQRDIVRQEIGKDARLGGWIKTDKRPVVTVLVVGETARAMNFSLNGYARKTNPELEKLDILNFPNATSCGTDTGYSLPCMFSVYPRAEFSKKKAKATQGLMDVIRHAGIDAYWWDNNTGSKGVADLISFSSLTNNKDPEHCQKGDCRDGIFLKKLEEVVGSAKKDTVIVLHQIGSHGPAYFARYPETFRKFKPDCRTPQLTDCPIADVVNAYDNTILYTDHFLAQVIAILEKHRQTESGAMLYMSDHGESLGENGLYLHGAPYAIAPPEQTHIPLIVWFSPDYKQRAGLDGDCLARLPQGQYSHDNFFHTVLGIMNVETSVYKPERDMFKDCRRAVLGQ